MRILPGRVPRTSHADHKSQDTFFPDVESVQTTQEIGGKFINQLRRSQDKNGRLIADAFLDLPDRQQYPEYYEQIPMPLSINSIDEKLKSGRYATMTELEGDLKRMVQNAKDFNSSKSLIFEDAERLRKALSNFMPKHNPAYADEKFRAVPTPVPDYVRPQRSPLAREGSALASRTRSISVSGSEQPPLKLKFSKAGSARPVQPATPSVAIKGEDDLEETFLALLDELSTQNNAINFENRVKRREVPDYYKVIERPTSINDVRKMVQQGNVTTWEEFAKEVRLIWSNAKEYNEPGSEIYTMTEELEGWFEDKLRDQGVPPKVVPNLRLSVSRPQPNIKLKMSLPEANGVNSSIISVDQAALERQNAAMRQAMQQAGFNSGRTPAANSKAVSASTTQASAPQTAPDIRPPSEKPVSVPPPLPVAPPTAPTPAVEIDPDVPVDPTSKPIPKPNINGYHTSAGPTAQSSSSSRPVTAILSSHPSTTILTPFDRRLRPPHKSSADALLQSVTYMTNPVLTNDPRWKLSRFASPTKTQQSFYIYLPFNHSSIRVIPRIHPELRHNKRRHKLFVVCNNTILPANPTVATTDESAGGAYDCTLRQGENVINVEVLADLDASENRETIPTNMQFEFERLTFYICLRGRDAIG